MGENVRVAHQVGWNQLRPGVKDKALQSVEGQNECLTAGVWHQLHPEAGGILRPRIEPIDKVGQEAAGTKGATFGELGAGKEGRTVGEGGIASRRGTVGAGGFAGDSLVGETGECSGIIVWRRKGAPISIIWTSTKG
jgi:hypothetical protein